MPCESRQSSTLITHFSLLPSLLALPYHNAETPQQRGSTRKKGAQALRWQTMRREETQRVRETQREGDTHTHTHTQSQRERHTHTHTHTQRFRDRHNNVANTRTHSHTHTYADVHTRTYTHSAPSYSSPPMHAHLLLASIQSNQRCKA